MQLLKSSIIQELPRLFLIVLFTYTAVSKLTNYHSFAFTLSESPLIHKGAGVLALLIPISELVIVLLLLFPLTELKGFYAAVLLLLLFTAYLIVMLLSGSKLPCSCGGVISKLSWSGHVGFNLVFIIIGVVGIRRKKIEGLEINV